MSDLKLPSYYKYVKKGEILCQQGDSGNSAYIIEEGSVDIVIKLADNTEQVVSTRSKGAMIGEMALVDNQKRTATVIAKEDCILLEITGEEFSRRLATTDPTIRMAMQVILLRYRDTLARVGLLSDSGLLPEVEKLERESSGADEVVRSVRMVSEIKDALSKGHIHLFYQPINDINDGHVLGFEALMRWIHPEKGIIPPNEFIPLAEESGLIVEMSKFALKRACEDLAIIEKDLGMTGLLYMSVNFTGKDLTAENFTDYVYSVLSETDTKPEKIQIEITERMLMDNPRAATETLEFLRKAGFRIAIDDFGTGYSSLSYLHYFPIDCLKIDRSFVSQMLENEGSMRLVQSIVSLAKNLNMTVTAEGIEEQSELDALKELECEYGQGYFFAKPLARDEIIQKLKEKDMLPDTSRISDLSEHQDIIEKVQKGELP